MNKDSCSLKGSIFAYSHLPRKECGLLVCSLLGPNLLLWESYELCNLVYFLLASIDFVVEQSRLNFPLRNTNGYIFYSLFSWMILIIIHDYHTKTCHFLVARTWNLMGIGKWGERILLLKRVVVWTCHKLLMNLIHGQHGLIDLTPLNFCL